MSIFTLSKFSADTVRERAEYFERGSDSLASFYLGGASKHLAVEGKPAKRSLRRADVRLLACKWRVAP